MIEQVAIGLLFVGAVVYAGSRLRKEFSPKKSGCSKGCGRDQSTT